MTSTDPRCVDANLRIPYDSATATQAYGDVKAKSRLIPSSSHRLDLPPQILVSVTILYYHIIQHVMINLCMYIYIYIYIHIGEATEPDGEGEARRPSHESAGTVLRIVRRVVPVMRLGCYDMPIYIYTYIYIYICI